MPQASDPRYASCVDGQRRPESNVGGPCNGVEMTEMIQAAASLTTNTIAAIELHVSDILIDGPDVHQVTSVRLQGTPPEALIELADVTGRRHYAAATQVRAQCPHHHAARDLAPGPSPRSSPRR